MSDSDESRITYTEVSSLFEDLSDIGSPRADDHEYLELPGMPEDPYVEAALQAPPSPDYVPGPEEPEQAPPSPDYVPGPEHTDDEIIAEDHQTRGEPIDYPADGGDDGDDEMDIEEDEDDDMDIEADEEDEDDEMDVEVDEEAEEAPALPTLPELVIILPAWSEILRLPRLHAISSPPASPLSPWSSSPPQIPFPLPPPIPSPSLPLSPPSPVLSAPPPSPIRSLGYRDCQDRMKLRLAATSHSLPLPPPFILSPTRPNAPLPLPTSTPTSLPPLLLPSASRREDRPEVNLPPRKRLGIALGPRYEVGESSAAAAARPAGGAPVVLDTELGAHVREFESMVRRDTHEIYTRLDDEQSQRQLLAGRVNMLFRDRRAHAHTRYLMETEARLSREAWGRSMDASDLAHGEVMSLRTTVHAQMSEIRELQSADRSRQRAISDLLKTDRGRRR
ncbi:hypothetical protein Tco_0805997 [Tanacetum coccineum]